MTNFPFTFLLFRSNIPLSELFLIPFWLKCLYISYYFGEGKIALISLLVEHQKYLELVQHSGNDKKKKRKKYSKCNKKILVKINLNIDWYIMEH